MTEQTEKDDHGALDAQNFHVPLTSVATDVPDEETFKQLAKTMAWSLTTHTVDENGHAGVFSDNVTVDAVQLAALQQAAVAKPYPVDVTYETDNGTTIVNRVWVFVTTKNTTVDTEHGIVIYADDYTLPIHLAQTESKADVYEHAHVRVYDYYDASHETTEPLTPLADKDTSAGLDVTNLSVITGAAGGVVVQPEIIYVSETGTTGTKPEVTITASALLHVRQVVYAEPGTLQDQLVVPTEGYVELLNTSTKQMNLVVPSGEAAANPAYVEFYAEVDNAEGNNQLTMKVTVPQYYDYFGYVVSDTAMPHEATALSGTDNYRYDFTTGVYEQWVTVYIQPHLENNEVPKQYSWDYKYNDLGEIDVE